MKLKLFVLSMACVMAAALVGCSAGRDDDSATSEQPTNSMFTDQNDRASTRPDYDANHSDSMDDAYQSDGMDDYYNNGDYGQNDDYGAGRSRTGRNNAVDDIGDAAGDLVRGAGNAVRDAGDAIGDAANNVGRAVR